MHISKRAIKISIFQNLGRYSFPAHNLRIQPEMNTAAILQLFYFSIHSFGFKSMFVPDYPLILSKLLVLGPLFNSGSFSKMAIFEFFHNFLLHVLYV